MRTRREKARGAWVLVAALAVWPGCEATFEDLRPGGGGQNTEGDLADVGGSDVGEDPDARDVAADSLVDGGDADVADADVADAGAPDAPEEVEPAEDVVLAQGDFGGRMGYEADGIATLVALAEGGYEVRFDSAFRAVEVPGPVVVLTFRDAIGAQLDTGAGDVELGTLSSNAGPQTYAVPETAIDRTWVWVYCKPFGVEVARAELMGVQ